MGLAGALHAQSGPERSDELSVTRAFLEDRVRSDPLDFIAQNKLSAHYLRLLRETGDFAWLDRAGQAARASLSAVLALQNPGGLTTLALVELSSHHFAAALELAQEAHRIDPRDAAALATAGDAALEMGNDAEAEAMYRQLADRDANPPVMARLSRLAELRGDNRKAIDLLRRAVAVSHQEGTSQGDAAWFQTRLGEMYFRTGRLRAADRCYEAALKGSPDSFAALEHLAELRAAQGRYDESLALYHRVLARVRRPELDQALGDLYAFMGRPAEARPWHDRALEGYLESIAQGNVHYYHHLASFYSDSREDASEALKWARKDLELRRSIHAYDALAWALYRAGNLREAVDAIQKALALGTQDAHLLHHAGVIYSRAGDLAKGEEFLRRAASINPSWKAFHADR